METDEKEAIKLEADEMNSKEVTIKETENWSAQIFRMIANDILPNSIRMKEDTPWNHDNQRLPILDTEMKMVDGQVIHWHNRKPVASLELTNMKTAMSTANKINILTQEGSRRLRNCSLSLPWQEQKEYLDSLSIQMMWCGYKQQTREIVIKRVLAKKENDLHSHFYNNRPIYRTKEERSLTMREDKSTWFRGSGATATITIPATRNSILAKKVRDTLIANPGPRGTSVKVVERPGPPIFRGLSKNEPFPRTSCGRPSCPLTSTDRGCREDCSSEGILYVASCQKCEGNPEAKNNIYIGESSRTLWVRANQHISDFNKMHRVNGNSDNTTSFMWDHWTSVHSNHGNPEIEKEFNFKILSKHKDPFDRQVTEAMRIEKALDSNILLDKTDKPTEIKSLNRRFEHFCPRIRPEKYDE